MERLNIYSTLKRYSVYIIPILVFLLFNSFFTLTFVKGVSMEPTYNEGNILLVQRTHRITRGDIIVFKHINRSKPICVIKRVIGIEGDVVNVCETNIDLNRKTLHEAYVQHSMLNPLRTQHETCVKKNTYFVLGDNRNFSEDSRYPSIGLIKSSEIIGKVVYKLK